MQAIALAANAAGAFHVPVVSLYRAMLCCSVQAVLEQRAEFGKRVVRKVPVEWIGVASEVKVMGDFDDWTRGHELSAEDVATDSVYSRCAEMDCQREHQFVGLYSTWLQLQALHVLFITK